MGIKHVFASAKADGADATQVQPSHWNNNHVIDTEISIPVVAAPAAPANGFVNFYGTSLGGRVMLSTKGPSGLDVTLQPHTGRQRCAWWQPLGNATTVPITTGFTAMTVVGTATARSVASTNLLTMSRRLGLVSVATAAGISGVYSTIANLFKSSGTLGGFHTIFRFCNSDAAAVTGARTFVGVAASVAAPTNVEPSTLTNCIGMAQLSTDATQWYIVYGGSGAQAAIALGTTLGAPTLVNTMFELSIFDYPNLANQVGYTVTNLTSSVSVSGTLTGVAGTALPAAGTAMTQRAWRCNNATALAVGLDVASIYQETDY
jgi:hypothetical protein